MEKQSTSVDDRSTPETLSAPLKGRFRFGLQGRSNLTLLTIIFIVLVAAIALSARMISPARASKSGTTEDDSETLEDRYARGNEHKNKGAAPPEDREKTETIPDVAESTADETTTSVPKAASTEADVESTAAAEEENRSETHASKTTNEKTKAVAKSRPSETPFVTTKGADHAMETTAWSRTQEGSVTKATRDKDDKTTPAKGVLLCTAGDFAVEKDMFPTDGLCDLLFYTHVRFLGHEFRGRYNEKSWRTFRRLAPASRKDGLRHVGQLS
ncbi:hypothetical protein MTO96_005567 [Rhipicephalus appendiculatus]